MSTLANVKTSESAHWYAKDGIPMHTVIAKGNGQPRPTTLRDAKQLGLLPSVTTILRVLHKEALVNWRCEQTALAVLTTPRNEGEEIDAFVYRVLHTEKVQDEESQKARDLGTDMHAAMEAWFDGEEVRPDLLPWIEPACKAISGMGQSFVATERVLVGIGYAGRTDLIQECLDCHRIWDFKTAKSLPTKSAWSEHVLQLSAYAAAYDHSRIETANCYISTVEQGKFVIMRHEVDWLVTYERGFRPLVDHWQWANNYTTRQSLPSA